LAGGDHQRGLVAVRGVDIAERIAEAGAGVKVGEAGVARGLRITVGHADDGGLLQAQHIVEVVRPVAEERQFRRAWIAEHFFDAERAQQAEGGVLDGERGAGRFCWFAGRHYATPGATAYAVIARSACDEAIHPSVCADRWIASRSLSSGGA